MARLKKTWWILLRYTSVEVVGALPKIYVAVYASLHIVTFGQTSGMRHHTLLSALSKLAKLDSSVTCVETKLVGS
jgi:hypothetical protein